MCITYFTILTAMLWFNLFAIITIILAKKEAIYKIYSLNIFFCLIIISIVKLLIIVEFPQTVVLNSEKVLPFLQKIANYSFNRSAISILFLLISISLMGTIVIHIKNFFYYVRLNLHLKYLTHIKEDDTCRTIMNEIIELIKINRHIKIYKNHNFISPMIMGYFHPIILLPDIEFTYEELKCILLHEVIHYKYKHIFFKFFVFILRSILWWNPLMYLWSDEINNILEYQTDRKVCSLLNIKEQTHYLNGIIKVIDNISADVKLPYASVGLIESDSEKVIIRRFKFILGNVYSSSSKLKSALLIIFFIICFLSSYLIVLQPYSEPTNENYNDNAPIISSDAYIKKTDNSYTIFTADGKEIATYSGEISEKYNYLEIKEE